MVQEFADRIQAYRRNVKKEQARWRKQKYRDKLLAAAKPGDEKAKVKIEKNRESAKLRMSKKRKGK